MPHAAQLRARQVGSREIVKIPLGHQHGARRVVEVEKVLQVGEPVGSRELTGTGPREGHVVAAREVHNHRRFQCALKVDVQLRPGQLGRKIVHRR